TLVRYPLTRTKVIGWISLQAPFYGSPVADEVKAYTDEFPSSDTALMLLAQIQHGEDADKAFEAYLDLGQQTRSLYMQVHASAIKRVVKSIRTLTFTSSSDDFVPIFNGTLPGALSVIGSGLGHLETVSYNSM